MKVVGITGGIGSGKTTICKVFSALGVPVFNSDEVSKSILFSPLGTQKVVDAFGDGVYENGEINRKKLAEKVFQDKQELKKLNSILHPLVAEAFETWKTKQNFPYCLKEAAILFESGSYKSCDFVITVSCEEEERIQRIVKRDSKSRQEILDILSNQWSEKNRLDKSDFVIKNQNEKVIPQIISIHNELLG